MSARNLSSLIAQHALSARNVSSLIALLGLFAVLFPAFQGGYASGEDTEPITVRSVEVSSFIDNAYAVTEITHTYENTGDEAGEAYFGLSIPEKAFISNFSLTLGNRTHYASVLTREEAQEKYDDAVASGKTAGLGEAEDTTTFSFYVNLRAGETAHATLRYEHYITRFLGERTFPLYLSSMTVHPETFQLKVDIASVAGVTGLSIENYEDVMNQEWQSEHELTLSAYLTGEEVDLQDDLMIRFTESSRPVNGSLVGYYDAGTEEYYFLNVFSPARDDIGGRFPKDIIFVLDKSGSMGTTKMDQLKESFAEILDQLPGEDRFGIIMFDDEINLFRSDLEDATDENKDQAKEYLNSQTSGGGTNLYGGLERALNMLTYTESRAPIIVMLTDGKPTYGQYQAPYLIRTHILEENTILCPIFTLGFGLNPDDFDFEFLTALSLENNARAQHIRSDQDVSEQIGNFYDTISTTLLKQIAIDYGGNAYDHFPGSISALYEGSESVIVGKLHLNGTEDTLTSTFTARTPEGQREFVTDYPVSTGDTEHDSVVRFWSYTRIYQLLDQVTLSSGDERDEIISEIENLSISAHFVTPYTSLYLEVEDENDEEEDPDSGDDGGEGSGDEGSDGSGDGSTYSSDSGSENSGNSGSDSAAVPYTPPQPRGGSKLGTPDNAPPHSSGDSGDGGSLGASSDMTIMPILSLIIAALVVISMTAVSKAKIRKRKRMMKKRWRVR